MTVPMVTANGGAPVRRRARVDLMSALAAIGRVRRRHVLATFVGLRALQAIPLLLAVIVLNFTLIHLAPGDPATLYVREGGASKARIEQIRAHLGLDKPPIEQLTHYVSGFARGDFGTSTRYDESVMSLIAGRIPATLLLAGSGILLSTVGGLLLAANAARRGSRTRDRTYGALALIAYATPPFVLGQLLLLLFALQLGWLPASGMHGVDAGSGMLASLGDTLKHLILPVVAYAAFPLALIYRLTRVGLREAMGEDFVTTARSKGLSRRRVVYRHAFPHAFLGVLAVIGFNLGFMLAGSVLIETVFSWPGLGRLLSDAIVARDFPLILGIFSVTAIAVVIANTLADVVHALIDPRVAEAAIG